MKNKLSLFIFIFVLLSSLTLANPQITQEGGTGLDLQGGLSDLGYASNYDNPTPYNYSYCNVDASKYNAIAFDLDKDGLTEYIYSSDSKITIYTSDCVIKAEIIKPVTAMPILTNWNDNEYQEITFMSNEIITSYEYDPDTEIYDNIEEGSIREFNLTNPKEYFTCYEDDITTNTICIILNANSRDVIYLNLVRGYYGLTGQIINTTLINELDDIIYNFDYLNGITIIETIPQVRYIPVCNVKANTGNQIKCNFLNGAGIQAFGFTITEGTASTAITDITTNSGYIAKVGNVYRFLWSFDYNKTTFRKRTAVMYDLSGNEIINIEDLAEKNITSNWAVGDYDKDGSSEACILQGNSSIAFLRCFNSAGTEIITQDFSSAMNVTEGFSIADIYNNAFMEVNTIEGIFSYNTTNSTGQKVLSTGINPSNRKGFTVPIWSDKISRAMSFTYSDYTGGVIFSSDTTGLFCGNNYCEDFENAFSCPEDCGVNVSFTNETGSNCNSNTDCDTGLCTNGICVQGGYKHPCNENSDCISDDCNNGICTRPSLFDNIDASVNEIVGDDTNSKNALAIAIMITLMIAIIIASRNIVGVLAGLLVFFILAIFFTIVGWLSAFILLGFIITAVIGSVVLIMLGTGGTG